MDTLENLKILKNRKKLNPFVGKKVVYKIRNTVDKKCYIGVTSRIKRRVVEHIKYSENNHKLSSYLHKAIRKHGTKKFVFEVLEIVDSNKDLNEREVFYINKLKSDDPSFGYNLTSGGGRGLPNDITILKKIAASHKVKVAKYDLQGHFICEYESIREAARQNGISDSDIHRCHKKKWTRGGYMYRKFKTKPSSLIDPFVSKRGLNLISGDGFQGKNKIKCKLISKKTKEVIEANSLSELSKKANISESQLHRIYKNKKHKKWKLIKLQ